MKKVNLNFIYFLKLSETRTILNNLPKGQKQSKSTIHDINEFKKNYFISQKTC